MENKTGGSQNLYAATNSYRVDAKETYHLPSALSLLWPFIFITGTILSLQSPVRGKKKEVKVCSDYPLPSGICFPSRGGWGHIWFQPQPGSSLPTLGEEKGGAKGQGNV